MFVTVLYSSQAGRTPGRAAKAKGQQSITSMFSAMASKRKSLSEGENAEKKAKCEKDDDR